MSLPRHTVASTMPSAELGDLDVWCLEKLGRRCVTVEQLEIFGKLCECFLRLRAEREEPGDLIKFFLTIPRDLELLFDIHDARLAMEAQ